MHTAKKLYLGTSIPANNEIKNVLYIFVNQENNISHKISHTNLKYQKIKQLD